MQDFLDTIRPKTPGRRRVAVSPSAGPIARRPLGSLTESGISFQDLACYQLLKAGTPLTRPLLEAVWIAFLSLRRLSRRRFWNWPRQTNGAESFAREKVRLMRRIWDTHPPPAGASNRCSSCRKSGRGARILLGALEPNPFGPRAWHFLCLVFTKTMSGAPTQTGFRFPGGAG